MVCIQVSENTSSFLIIGFTQECEEINKRFHQQTYFTTLINCMYYSQHSSFITQSTHLQHSLVDFLPTEQVPSTQTPKHFSHMQSYRRVLWSL